MSKVNRGVRVAITLVAASSLALGLAACASGGNPEPSSGSFVNETASTASSAPANSPVAAASFGSLDLSALDWNVTCLPNSVRGEAMRDGVAATLNVEQRDGEFALVQLMVGDPEAPPSDDVPPAEGFSAFAYEPSFTGDKLSEITEFSFDEAGVVVVVGTANGTTIKNGERVFGVEPFEIRVNCAS